MFFNVFPTMMMNFGQIPEILNNAETLVLGSFNPYITQVKSYNSKLLSKLSQTLPVVPLPIKGSKANSNSLEVCTMRRVIIKEKKLVGLE